MVEETDTPEARLLRQSDKKVERLIMALSAEELRQDFEQKFGTPVESALQNPIEYYKVPRPDIYAWLQSHPEVYDVVGRPPPIGAYYTEGGVQYTAGGQVLAQEMPTSGFTGRTQKGDEPSKYYIQGRQVSEQEFVSQTGFGSHYTVPQPTSMFTSFGGVSIDPSLMSREEKLSVEREQSIGVPQSYSPNIFLQAKQARQDETDRLKRMQRMEHIFVTAPLFEKTAIVGSTLFSGRGIEFIASAIPWREDVFGKRRTSPESVIYGHMSALYAGKRPMDVAWESLTGSPTGLTGLTIAGGVVLGKGVGFVTTVSTKASTLLSTYSSTLGKALDVAFVTQLGMTLSGMKKAGRTPTEMGSLLLGQSISMAGLTTGFKVGFKDWQKGLGTIEREYEVLGRYKTQADVQATDLRKTFRRVITGEARTYQPTSITTRGTSTRGHFLDDEAWRYIISETPTGLPTTDDDFFEVIRVRMAGKYELPDVDIYAGGEAEIPIGQPKPEKGFEGFQSFKPADIDKTIFASFPKELKVDLDKIRPIKVSKTQAVSATPTPEIRIFDLSPIRVTRTTTKMDISSLVGVWGSSIFDVQQKQYTKQATNVLNRSLSKQMPTTKERTLQRLINLPAVSTLTLSRTLVSEKTRLVTPQRLRTGLSFPSPSPMKIPPSVPIIPRIRLPDIPKTHKSFFKKSLFGKPKKTAYKPSLEALHRGIYGKLPKSLTGLGLRPIGVRKMARRKKRRKKK